MKTYTEEFKTNIVTRMLPPNNCSVSSLTKETGIPGVTLRTWLGKYGNIPVGANVTGKGADSLTSVSKFQHVLESATLNEHELGEFCRRRGIFPEQLAAWRNACMTANEGRSHREDRSEQRDLTRQIKMLEGDLRMKEKALAEAAALLILQKKTHLIWGDNGDVRSHYRSDVR
jgi:transposase-like protein